MKKTYNFYVVYTEYERGWGSKDFHAMGFNDKQDALNLINEENSKNTSLTAPEYYIQCSLETDDYYSKYIIKNDN